MNIKYLNEETRHNQVNAEQIYDAWLEAKRVLVPGSLVWKHIGDYTYLYRLRDSKGNGTSLGRDTSENIALHQQYTEAKRNEKELWNRLHMYGGLINRVGRAASVPGYVGAVLRELDLEGALGTQVVMIGTHALAAYAAEAGVVFTPSVTATHDMDLTRVFGSSKPFDLLRSLKNVEVTFVVNQEKTFQARDRHGHEVDILMAAEDVAIEGHKDAVHPMTADGQDWLHLGRPVERVVFDDLLFPAKIVVPDPRYFALHKMWLSQQEDRHPLKRHKDRQQAVELMAVIVAAMPHYPLDADFVKNLPAPLIMMLPEFGSAVSSAESTAGLSMDTDEVGAERPARRKR